MSIVTFACICGGEGVLIGYGVRVVISCSDCGIETENARGLAHAMREWKLLQSSAILERELEARDKRIGILEAQLKCANGAVLEHARRAMYATDYVVKSYHAILIAVLNEDFIERVESGMTNTLDSENLAEWRERIQEDAERLQAEL